MKKYFFGYLFVRIAKILAALILLVGVGFALLKYSQASIDSASVAYQASPSLRRDLATLKTAFVTTEQIVSSFNSSNHSSTPSVSGPHFPALIDLSSDFDRIEAEFARTDQERQQLKESVVSRFEALISVIEQKLRAHAAELQATPTPNPVAQSTPIPSAAASPTPPRQPDSLFSRALEPSAVTERTSSLAGGREFLRVLGTKAENSENRTTLSESADQLDILMKLLPQKEEVSDESQQEPAGQAPVEPAVEQARNAVAAEKIADQIQHLRARVRQTILTSWLLDDTFAEASDLAATEKQRCRVAELQQRGIWLAAGGQVVSGLLVAALLSFLILVFADLTQTLLDTATNTGTMAHAVKTGEKRA